MKGKKLRVGATGNITTHSAGNLKRHLKNVHGLVYGVPENATAAARGGAGSTKLVKGQQSITQFARMSPAEEDELLQACVLFCALDNRPFVTVEGRGFKHLLKKATRGRWSMPGRRTVARRCTVMADQARAATRQLIKKDTADGANFTYSFDAWTDRCVHACGRSDCCDWVFFSTCKPFITSHTRPTTP